MSHLDARSPIGPRGLVQRLSEANHPKFSLCTMLTNSTDYAACRESFIEHGFDPSFCEYLVVDNSDGNKADAYTSLNEFLQVASADHIVIHHHDIVLLEHDLQHLSDQLDDLTAIDPNWAVCGNAGAMDDGWPAISISHPYRKAHVQGGPFPTQVVSLDENFLVVRRIANLALSRDLSGFHHYGADLCTVADLLGWNVYVIDFYLRHNSGGTMDHVYSRSRRAITKKYQRAFRPRWMELVTNQPFYLSGSRLRNTGAQLVRRVAKGLGWFARTRDFDDPVKSGRRNSKRHKRLGRQLTQHRLIKGSLLYGSTPRRKIEAPSPPRPNPHRMDLQVDEGGTKGD